MSLYPDKRIPMSELKDRVTYFGGCRNATRAIWLADKKRFVYVRSKFTSLFTEEIMHLDDPELHKNIDGFGPESEATPEQLYTGKHAELIAKYLAGYERQSWTEHWDD